MLQRHLTAAVMHYNPYGWREMGELIQLPRIWDQFRSHFPPADAAHTAQVEQACSRLALHPPFLTCLRSWESKYGISRSDYSALTIAFLGLQACRAWFGERPFLKLCKIHFIEYTRELRLGCWRGYVHLTAAEQALKKIAQSAETNTDLNLVEYVNTHDTELRAQAQRQLGWPGAEYERTKLGLVRKWHIQRFEHEIQGGPEVLLEQIAYTPQAALTDNEAELALLRLLEYSLHRQVIQPAERRFWHTLLRHRIELAPTRSEQNQWDAPSQLLGVQPKTLQKKFSRFSERLAACMKRDGITPTQLLSPVLP